MSPWSRLTSRLSRSSESDTLARASPTRCCRKPSEKALRSSCAMAVTCSSSRWLNMGSADSSARLAGARG